MLDGQVIVGTGAFTKNGSTHSLVVPEQLERFNVMLWTPGPTGVPAAGDWVMLRDLDYFLSHPEWSFQEQSAASCADFLCWKLDLDDDQLPATVNELS